jgi:hypothetical protein
MGYFSAAEFFKQNNVYGVRCQCSGVRKIQRTEHRKQMTEDKGQTVSVFCHLTSVICYLTPETRHLTPKIKPCFVNYLRDVTLGA